MEVSILWRCPYYEGVHIMEVSILGPYYESVHIKEVKVPIL